MPEFITDTAGTVNGVSFDDLCTFTQGYVEAMFWTSCCTGIAMTEWAEPENVEDVEEGRADGSIPTDSGWGDLHPKSGEAIQLDCFNFEAQAGDLLREAYKRGYDAAQAGHDFWLTRNGHGTGFWDRDVLENPGVWEENGSPRVGGPGWDAYMVARENSLGKQLTKIAKGFGEVYVTFGEAADDSESATGYGFVFHE